MFPLRSYLSPLVGLLFLAMLLPLGTAQPCQPSCKVSNLTLEQQHIEGTSDRTGSGAAGWAAAAVVFGASGLLAVAWRQARDGRND